MTLYITQGNYSPNALAGMIAKPDDREAAVRKLLEAAGNKMLQLYFTFGQYDFLIVSESQGDVTSVMASLSLAASSGNVSNLITVPALSNKDAMKAFAQAGKIKSSYRPPGQ
jgi:uncharacterized protein with GYD domain